MKLRRKTFLKQQNCMKDSICIHLCIKMSIKINQILSGTFVYEPILLLMLTFLVTYLYGLKSDFIKTFYE